MQEPCQVTRGRASPAAADGGVVAEQHADGRLGDAESSDVLPVFAVFDWLVAHVLAAAHRTSRATNAARSEVSRRMVTGMRAARARVSVAG